MMKKTSLFLIFNLCLCVALMRVFGIFQNYFDGTRAYEGQIVQMKYELQKLDLMLALKENELSDFKQNVAKVLPEVSSRGILAKRDVRMVASIASVPTKTLSFNWSAAAFEEGRNLFREKKFDQAIVSFKKTIEMNSSSKHLPEAYFLLAESYYLSGQASDFLRVVDQMITLYPDQDLTGFILLRMGQLFIKQSRPDEAKEVFSTIMKSFDLPELKSQASVLKSKLGG